MTHTSIANIDMLQDLVTQHGRLKTILKALLVRKRPRPLQNVADLAPHLRRDVGLPAKTRDFKPPPFFGI